MATVNKEYHLAFFLRLVLGSLIGMFLSGIGMTAIGQPTTSHLLSSSGSTLWHVLLVFHLLFLAGVTVGSVTLLVKAFTQDNSIKLQAVLGTVAVVFGIVCGSLVLHKVHPGIFLFLMALSFLVIGFAYGPIARSRNIKMH
jgi:hypothetical protein